MTTRFTRKETVAAVPGLSEDGLSAFLAAGLVVPRCAQGAMFRESDLARLALLCDLADGFDLDGDGLAVVIDLIDQLHETRRHLRAMARAMEPEAQDLRLRVGARFIGFLAV